MERGQRRLSFAFSAPGQWGKSSLTPLSLFAKAKTSGLATVRSSSSSEATAEDGHGRTSPASERCARAVVRQRLVVANHQARECNAPDQSMSVSAQGNRA